MWFTLNGKRYQLTADDVLLQLHQVKPEPVHQLGVWIDGNLYPVKQAFEVATDIPRAEFVSQTAARHLASLGFEITRKVPVGDGPPAAGSSSAQATGNDSGTDTSDLTDLRAGDVFAGRYRIVRLLGEGDRKVTYLALDTSLDRPVALALVKPSAARLDRLGTKREAAALVQVGAHDNIVTLYDRGTVGDTEYLVFEYLPGGTLREYLAAQDEHRLSVEDVMRLGRQLARALSHVHGRGVIHRDVAPANIWLDERNVAHLGDFDTAVSLSAQDSAETLPPTTEAYAPPEQTLGIRLDQRADLYSLGAVLYEAATGQRPERGEKRVLAPRAVRPDIPPSLNATIYKLLSESPENRPLDAAALLQMLRPAIRADEGFLPWAETLPFPLASVLRLYHVEIGTRARAEHLLNFFEVLSQFMVTIELSACKSDQGFFDANRASWFGVDPDNPRPIDFRVATFGMWVNLHRRLANTARRMLSEGPDGVTHCHEMFAAKDDELIDAITSRDLAVILDEACRARNEWSHSGIVNPRDYSRRLRELDDLLAKAQARLATAFETWELLSPGSATYAEGIYDYTVTVLRGTNPPFRKEQVRVRQPLDSTRLYMRNCDSQTALELIPLLRMRTRQDSAGDQACYFYNRLQPNGDIRWISYHFLAEPEILAQDDRTAQILSELRAP